VSRFARVGFIILLLVCLAAALTRSSLRLLPDGGAPPAQKVAAFGPCMDHRPGQPDAAPVPGLSPRTLLFSSDCRWLLSGNRNGSIQVIDRESGKLLAQAAGHVFQVENMVLSPDDKLLFSSSTTQEDVMVWSLPDLKRLGTVQTSRRGSPALAYDATRGVLATGASGQLHLWKIALDGASEVQIAEPLFSLKPQGTVHSLAFSPDKKLLAAGLGGAVELWEYDGARLTPLARTPQQDLREWVMAIAFTRDAKALVTGTRGKKIAVWQVPTLEPARQAAADPANWSLYTDPTRFTARPPREYAGPDKASLVFEIDDAIADRIYLAATGHIFTDPIAWRGLVQAAGNAGGISFFDIYSNRPGPVLSIPSSQGPGRGAMRNFAMLPERSLLAVKRDADLLVIDLASLKVTNTLQMAGKAELQWIGDGATLAYSNAEEVGFVTVASGEVRKVPRPAWNGQPQLINLQLGASLDGKGVAAVFGDRLVEIDTDLRVKDVARLPLMAIELVAPVAPKNAYLVAGMDSAALFGGGGAETSIPSRVSNGLNAALSPDAGTLYVKENDKLCRYRFDAPAPCDRFATPDNPGMMALDTDGRLLVEGGHKKKIRVLDLSSGMDLAQLEGHLGEIIYVRLLGNRVLSADSTGELRLWSLETRELVASSRP
jgi:WD40 repeat protein